MQILSLQKLIDDSLSLENSEPRVPSGKFNPSYLGQCLRKHYWKRKGEEPSNPPDARAYRIFKCGHLFEYFMANLIPAQDKQIMVSNDDFMGFADVVTDDEVIDIKSINSKAFWYMDKPTYKINEEKYHNILQVIYYAKQLGKPKARLVFISKDDLCIREYGFFTIAWEDKLNAEIEALKGVWQKQVLPEADPRAAWECNYCSFKDKCKLIGGKVWKEKA